jgi:tetratricopeptide (TPR) repeat protein
LSLFAFVLALLSKTAVAPLPLVFLLLAWWKRGRVAGRDVWRTVPFFAAAMLLIPLTIVFEHQAGAEIIRTDNFWSRLAGAGWCFWFYLYKALAPLKLMFIYPRWRIDPAQLLSYGPDLLVVLGFGVCWRYRRGWGKAGLLGLGYFLVMILPALGFVNIYFMRFSLVADHWQYFAIIGPSALLAAALTVGWERLGRANSDLGIALGGALILVLGVLTWKQAHIYADEETLWQDTLAENPACYMAHNNLGNALLQMGRESEAIPHFQKALQIQPDYAEAHYNLGNALVQEGRLDEALAQYRTALQIQPDFAEAHSNLGNALLSKGQVEQALVHLQKAVESQPDYAEWHCNLANALRQAGRVDEALAHYQQALTIQPRLAGAYYSLGNLLLYQKGQVDEAIAHYQKALELRPDYPEALNNLGGALIRKGRVREAINQFQTALDRHPDFAPACNSLAWLLATTTQASVRDGARAITLARQADRLAAGNNPVFIGTLAAAYAEAGRFPEANVTSQRAVQLATAQNQTVLAAVLLTHAEAYQNGSPFRDTGDTGN